MKKIIQYTLFVLFTFSPFFDSFSQIDSMRLNKQIELLKMENDSLKKENETLLKEIKFSSSESSIDRLKEEYISILINSNEQLNKTWTPINVSTSILGILITVLTIIGSIAFYFLGKDFKNKQKKTIQKFESKFEELHNTKEREINLQISTWAKKVEEFMSENQSMINTDEKKYVEISRFLRNFVIRNYTHSGYYPKDIIENVEITENLNFKASISLNTLHQEFSIYFKVLANDNTEYWFGFAGGDKNEQLIYKKEYTERKVYDTLSPQINVDLISYINQYLNEIIPLRITKIRLRASDKNKNAVGFEYVFFEV